jgi:hypothetical protein
MGVLDKGAGEDVATSEGAFCVAMLARLSGADLEDLAGLGLEDCVAAFSESRGLGRVGERGVCVTGNLGIAKSVFWSRFVRHSEKEGATLEELHTSAAYLSSSEWLAAMSDICNLYLFGCMVGCMVGS